MRGQAWRRWAGFAVASSYELTHEREYQAIRNAAALFDVSPRCALIEDQKSSPLELSLDWTVAFDKPRFNGRRALRDEQARGPAWRFVGVEVDWTSLEQLYADRGLAPRDLPSLEARRRHV